MANKKLSYNDIAEKGLFEPLKKEIKEVDEALEATAKNLKTLITESKKLANSNPLESYKDMKDAEKAIEDTGKAVEKLDKIEKERKKLQEQLLQLEDDRIKKNFELREEINQQKRTLREAAKEAKNSGDAYKVLTKRTNEAQKRFKTLAAQFGVTSKEAKVARKEFEKLDKELREVNEAAKDGRRDVGRYGQAVEKVNDKIDKLNTTISGAVLIAGLAKVVELFNSSAEGSDFLSKTLGTVTVSLAAFLNVFVRASQAEGIGGFFEALQEGFANLPSEIEKGVAALLDAVDAERQLTTQTNKLVPQLAQLRKEQALLESQASDTTLSTREQLEFTEQAILKAQEATKIELDLAKQREEAARLRVQSNKTDVAAQEELANATAERIQTEQEAIVELSELSQQASDIRVEQAEEGLDILLDVADRRKTINERIIADDRQSLKDRNDALDAALKQIEQSVEGEVAQIQKLLDAQFEARKFQAEQRKEAFNETKKVLNLETLLRIENVNKLNEEVDALQLGGNARNRLREVIIEYIAAQQDLGEAAKDVNDVQEQTKLLLQESTALTEELQLVQENGKDLQESLFDLTQKRLEKEIKLLTDSLSFYDETSVARLEIEKEISEKQIELARNRNEKEIEEERKKQQQLQEISEAGFEVLNSLNQKRSEDRINNLDEQLEAARERESELKELAERGSTDAEESLAALQQRQAELALQREQEIQRQQTFELALAAIQTYTAKVQAGENPAQAIASTLTDISLLQSLVQALPAFFEGTEDTGKAVKALDSEGGRLAVLHDNERVMTKKQNALIPKGMSNMELAILANQSQFLNDRQPVEGYQTEILSELKGMKKAIIEKKEYLGTDYNRMKGFITDIYRKQNRTVKEHHKIGRAFR